MNISRKDETNALQFIQNMVFTGKVKQAPEVQSSDIQGRPAGNAFCKEKQSYAEKQGITLHPETLKVIAVVIITILSTLI